MNRIPIDHIGENGRRVIRLFLEDTAKEFRDGEAVCGEVPSQLRLFACQIDRPNPNTRDGRRESAEQYLKDSLWVGRSDRWIADQVGVSGSTVSRYRRTLESVGAIETRFQLEAADGRLFPRTPTAVDVRLRKFMGLE